MFKDSNDEYQYACSDVSGTEYDSTDIKYPKSGEDAATNTDGVSGTDYISVFGTVPGATDSASYALEIKKGDNDIRITGVEIVGFNTILINNSIYIINIPLYGPSTAYPDKLVRTRAYRAQITLDDAFADEALTITSISTTSEEVPTNGIK